MRLLFAGVCIISYYFGPMSAVAADISCAPLLNDLREHLFRGTVKIRHSTNYLTNAQSFNGYVYGCFLNRMPQRAFSGEGNTCTRRIFREGQKMIEEPMRYEITADAKMTFILPNSNARHGPYDMTCLGNKFAIVNTSDSI